VNSKQAELSEGRYEFFPVRLLIMTGKKNQTDWSVIWPSFLACYIIIKFHFVEISLTYHCAIRKLQLFWLFYKAHIMLSQIYSVVQQFSGSFFRIYALYIELDW
jgi:hypothetical protein